VKSLGVGVGEGDGLSSGLAVAVGRGVAVGVGVGLAIGVRSTTKAVRLDPNRPLPYAVTGPVCASGGTATTRSVFERLSGVVALSPNRTRVTAVRLLPLSFTRLSGGPCIGSRADRTGPGGSDAIVFDAKKSIASATIRSANSHPASENESRNRDALARRIA
jgi:hypothetical protein